jgi:hypothetical protein
VCESGDQEAIAFTLTKIVVLLGVHRAEPPLKPIALYPRHWSHALGHAAPLAGLQEHGDPVRRLENGPQELTRRVTIDSGHRMHSGHGLGSPVLPSASWNARSAENLSSDRALSSAERRHRAEILADCAARDTGATVEALHVNPPGRVEQPPPTCPRRRR